MHPNSDGDAPHLPSGALPLAFEDLSSWAQIWNYPDIAGRYDRRKRSSMAELSAFYSAVMPRMEEILSHLDPFDLYNLPEPERRLYRMLCGLCEVSAAIELLNRPYLLPPGGRDIEYIIGLPVL